MDPVYKPPNILRLTGITLKDYVPVEDVADAHFLDTGIDGQAADPEAPAPESAHPPDKIPRAFTGLDDWPLTTNLRCWVCDFTFDDRPKFVPTYVREGENGGLEFGVLGNMCTFNCAELWIETHLGGRAGNEERWRAQDNLCLVYLLFTGRRVTHIKPAPCKTKLRQYGGEWDEDTFWRKMRALDPVAGLRDHTPGSVVPERDRTRTVLSILRADPTAGARPVPRVLAAGLEAFGAAKQSFVRSAPGGPLLVSPASVWGVCGLRAQPRADPAEDSVALSDGPAEPPGGGPDAPGAGGGGGRREPPRPDNLASPAADDFEALIAEATLGETSAEAALEAILAEEPAPQKAAELAVSDYDMDLLLAELGAL